MILAKQRNRNMARHQICPHSSGLTSCHVSRRDPNFTCLATWCLWGQSATLSRDKRLGNCELRVTCGLRVASCVCVPTCQLSSLCVDWPLSTVCLTAACGWHINIQLSIPPRSLANNPTNSPSGCMCTHYTRNRPWQAKFAGRILLVCLQNNNKRIRCSASLSLLSSEEASRVGESIKHNLSLLHHWLSKPFIDVSTWRRGSPHPVIPAP